MPFWTSIEILTRLWSRLTPGATVLALVLMACGRTSGPEDAAGPSYLTVPTPGETPPPPPEVIQFVSAGVTLEGTLELPGHEGPYPLLVFIHGSGRRTRSDYESFVPDAQLRGYAVFRYDKRGVGASGGVYSGVNINNSNAQIPLLAGDAAAAVETLYTHEGIDSNRIILMGSSQAGWIIPVAAQLSSHVSCNVSIVGPTVSVGEENYYSALVLDPSLTDSAIAALLAAYPGPYGFDPIGYIYTLPQPTLWIFGGEDESIPTYASIAALDTVMAAFPKEFTITLYPNGTHGLIDVMTGERIEFRPPMFDWLYNVSQDIEFPVARAD